MQVEPPGDDVAKPFAEHVNGVRFVWPKRLEKVEPLRRRRRTRVVGKRHSHLSEIERGVRIELQRRHVEQAVASRHNSAGLAAVVPTGLFETFRKDNG